MNSLPNLVLTPRQNNEVYIPSIPVTGVKKVNLNWSGNFEFPGMIQLYMLGDGSCYFHSIAYAFYKPYRLGIINGKKLDRREFIRNLRYDLAMKLNTVNMEVNPSQALTPDTPLDETFRLNRVKESDTVLTGQKSPYGSQDSIDTGTKNNFIDENGKLLYYDTLSKGSLREFSAAYPKYKLENLQKELLSNNSVDIIYHEYISNLLNKDIYILDAIQKDVYILPDPELYFKGRDSIVLLWSLDHYDLVGLEDSRGSNNSSGRNVKTYFSANSSFIKYIRNRIYAKTGKVLVI